METKDVEETLASVFFDRVEKNARSVAHRRKVLGVWEELTWSDYADHVCAVASALIGLGVEAHEAVGLIAENRVEWLHADLGILAAGAVTCAMYPTSSAEQIAYIIGHSGVRVIIVENEEQLDKILEVRRDHPLVRIVVLDEKGLRDLDDPQVIFWDAFLEEGRHRLEADPKRVEERCALLAPDDLAILVYTSGTTGPPKGVMLSHRNILWTCEALRKLGGFESGDEVLSFLPLCHIAERVLTVFYQVVHQTVVSFAENLDTVQHNLAEVRPHFFFAVPRVWEKFHSAVDLKMRDASWGKRRAYSWALEVGRRTAVARREHQSVSPGQAIRHALADHIVFRPLRKKLGLDRARFVASGAAPISVDVVGYFQAIGIPLVEAYGQTESTALITANQPGFVTPGKVGFAVDGVELRIAEDGEILARSPGVMLGYFRDPEATADAIDAEGWLHTGDVGALDDGGALRITDRKKDLIITAGGKNVAPQYIENKLRVSPYIHDAVVVGEGRKYLAALIVLDEDNLIEWAQKNRAVFGAYAELAKSEAVEKLIRDEVDRVNDTLTHVEAIKKFRILERRLDRDEGELTPTLKVRRKMVFEKYRALIDEMYSAAR